MESPLSSIDLHESTMKTSFGHQDEKPAKVIQVPAMEEVPEALTNISAKEVLINTSVEETELTHISDEEKMLTDSSAKEEMLTNIPAEDMAHTNVLAEEEALTNVLAEEEALTNVLADDGAALTNSIVSEAENDVIRVEYKITRHDPFDVGPGMDSKPHADHRTSQNETKTVTLSANIYVDDKATKSSAGETFDMPTTLESSGGDHSKLPSEKVEEVETTFKVSQSSTTRENVIIDNNKIELTTPAATFIKIETTPDDDEVSTVNGSLVQEFYHRELLLLQLMRGGQQQGPAEAVLAGWLGRQPMPTDGGSGGGMSVDWSVLISVVLTCLFFLAVFLVHQLRRTTANRRRRGPNQKRRSPLSGSPEEGELEEEEGGGSLYEYPRYCFSRIKR
jgi:hypothetical protein